MDVSARKLDFEHGAVMGGAKQDRLLLQRRAGLALRQDLRHDARHLRDIVGDGDEGRTPAARPLAAEILGETFACQTDHGVRCGEDRLCRTVVLLQRDDVRGWAEAFREVQDVANVRGAEAVNRLRIVATTVTPAPSGFMA